MAADQLFRQFHALRMGSARGHGARVDGIEVPPGRQHIGAAPVGRTGGTSGHSGPFEGGQDALPFGLTLRTTAEDMQAVAILRLLDIADKTVDPGDGFGSRGVGGQAQISLDPLRLRLVPHGADQAVAARGVDAIGGGIFVEQTFKAGEGFGDASLGQRGRQVAKGHGTDAAFGLGSLARVIDNKGINHRQRADQRLGPAGRG